MGEGKHFMISTSEFDFAVDMSNELKVIGLPERNKRTAMSLKPGDKIVFYVSKLSIIGGIAEVTGEYFYEKKRIWSDLYDLWPHRVPARPVYLIKNITEGIKAKDLLDDLLLVRNKHAKWGCYFQGSFKNISAHDYLVFENALKRRISPLSSD